MIIKVPGLSLSAQLTYVVLIECMIVRHDVVKHYVKIDLLNRLESLCIDSRLIAPRSIDILFFYPRKQFF